MPQPLEELLAKLGQRQADPRLAGLEARAWRQIASLQREVSPATLWGWRSAAAAALLGIGVAASRWLFPANPESTESETKVEYGPRNAANQEDAEYLAA